MNGDILYLFPGTGIQQKKMLERLSAVSYSMSRVIADIAEAAEELIGADITDEEHTSPFCDQLRIFASESALYRHWTEKGCSKGILIGHSLGEYAAAYCCGILSLEDSIKLLGIRQRILERSYDVLKMCAVNLSRQEIEKICEKHMIEISVAAVNAPSRITVVGEKKAVRKLMNLLAKSKTDCFPILSPGGSHCGFFRKYRDEYISAVENAKISFGSSSDRMISSVSCCEDLPVGGSAEYWFEHIVNTVDFASAVRKAVESGICAAVDLGVSPNLIGSAMLNAVGSEIKWVPSVRFGTDYKKRIAEAENKLFEK